MTDEKLEFSKENLDELDERIAKVQHYIWIHWCNPKKQVHYSELSESDKYRARRYARRVIVALHDELFKERDHGSDDND